MDLKISKINKNIFIFIFIFFFQSIAFPYYAFEKTKGYEENLPKKNGTIKENQFGITSKYLIGSGDVLIINFDGINEYSREYQVDAEGFLKLPEFIKFFASGLTTKELERNLNIIYDTYIINPNIDVFISKYRPINIFISGEVKSPGLYTIDGYQSPSKPQQYTVPTLYRSLQLTDGVKSNADLTNIKIIRNNSKTQGGGKIQTKVNMLSLILEGDQSQNIRLFDGDNIIVPKSESNLKDQILAVKRSNLTPKSISVFITGNVKNPGEIELGKGSSLIQAIASSGGKKLMTGNIEFIRFNDDGTTTKNKFKYDDKAFINTDKNPILADGDIINVQKTILGKANEILSEISSPLLSGVGIYSLF